MTFVVLFIYFVFWPFLFAQDGCRGLLIHLIIFIDTLGRTPMDEGSARRRGLFL